MKNTFMLLLLCMLFLPLDSFGNDLYEEQLNKGITNSEPYSYLLIEQSRLDKSRAKSILKEALKYSPDLPAVYFELSKASFNFKPLGIFESIDYILQGISAYERNFWWFFMVTASLFTSLILSFIISISLIVLIRLPKDIPLLSHDIKEEKTGIMLLLILVFSVFGPLYLLGGLLILLSFYLKKWNRLVIYLYLFFLLISPWILNIISTGLTAPSSAKFKAVVEVNESQGNTYALSALKDGNNPVELFSYALALKRQGSYKEAIDIYRKLMDKKPEPGVYNNLANCYVALNELEKAKELYRKSAELKPSPAVLYNLSQVYRETLDFDKGEEYFTAAQQQNREAVSRFREIFGRNPNRSVIDEGLPFSVLLDYAWRQTTHTFTIGLSIVPPAFMPIIALVMMIVFYVMDRRYRSRAYKCNRCGTILCSKCEKRIFWGHMCLQCYRSLVKLDELDAKERIARILTVYDYRKNRRSIIKLLSFVLPGSGQIYAGNILYGLVFLWPFLFFLFIPVTNLFYRLGMSSFSHSWLNICSLFLMSLTYILSNIITRRRIAKGWL